MKSILIIIVFLCLTLVRVQAQGARDGLSLSGYIKTMPALQLDRDFGNPEFLNILHNRINTRWDIAPGWRFAAEGRNRLFYNNMFSDFPEYRNILEQDHGLIDMSWVWLSEGSWIGHTNVDRLYLDWRGGDVQVRVGRQRINWGITLVSNPNDLFNTYSFFDFDYPERPGTDAVRVQYHTGFASRIEAAYSPARNSRESTAAFLWAVNHQGYDIQALGGYFRNRSALGIGWAGSIGGAGFKGEATWFYDLEKRPGVDRGNLVAAAGLDYMFTNSTFVVLEALYNGGYGRTDEGIFLLNEPMRPDNIMFSKYAITLNAQHPFTAILSGGMAVMALPDISAAFVMPNLSWSLMTDLDLEFVAQIFTGGQSSILENAGSSWFVSLQYSF